ncbi:hypothetical protein PI124_g9575 [Phytophthora idaei]|nr:hypothetical protein PI125_g9397 [Phytophthora idaei]KAG3138008.1 hypothetical protein PI126_g17118 [Phytophthora idaei]KAG3245685.1 hypothetical protein PI124_g9575 [Phytophthora idaei]
MESALCLARVVWGLPKVWDYGVVLGYSWKDASKTGGLHVTFTDEACEIPYEKEELQDLALEI